MACVVQGPLLTYSHAGCPPVIKKVPSCVYSPKVIDYISNSIIKLSDLLMPFLHHFNNAFIKTPFPPQRRNNLNLAIIG
jgi:hypothetical protein